MARTESTMVELGTKAPDFALPDTVSGHTVTLSDCLSDTATVIIFMCNHCPFVKHILPKLVTFAADYKRMGISFVAISSNDVDGYPEDSPQLMKSLADEMQFSFPYLYDEDQSVARAYNAACTPDFYVYDKDQKLVYRGQFDGARPGNSIAVTGNDLGSALDAILDGNEVDEIQLPSIGCNIKWKD